MQIQPTTHDPRPTQRSITFGKKEDGLSPSDIFEVRWALNKADPHRPHHYVGTDPMTEATANRLADKLRPLLKLGAVVYASLSSFRFFSHSVYFKPQDVPEDLLKELKK